MNTASQYTCEIVGADALNDSMRSRMRELYLASYDATSAALFDHDLRAKDEALLLHADGQLVGFTTLKVFDESWRGEDLRVVYSGDTVVERRHWGQQALSFEWVRRAGQIKRQRPDTRLVWLLLVKGHRTYRYLHVFAKTFHPREGVQDEDLAALTEHLARRRFGRDYNAVTDVLEFSPSRGQLKEDLAEPHADELARPGVAYFLRRNPGYRRGHELVCVCDLEERNLKPMTARLFRQGFESTCADACRRPAPAGP